MAQDLFEFFYEGFYIFTASRLILQTANPGI